MGCHVCSPLLSSQKEKKTVDRNRAPKTAFACGRLPQVPGRLARAVAAEDGALVARVADDGDVLHRGLLAGRRKALIIISISISIRGGASARILKLTGAVFKRGP